MTCLLEGLREIIATAFLIVGVFFYFSGALGLLRFPDVYNRIHAATKTSTIGVVAILLSGVVALGIQPVSVKAMVIVLFLLLTYPVAGHLLARAAYRTGVVLTDRTLHDEYGPALELEEIEEDEAGPEEREGA
ncbi:MAG: monovalent cation/H(+) antiporter subunit G [Thermoplasmata archaeon]